jgi:LPS O-antigen subunit length determinant protein (WzzB/FepE family)
MENDKQRNVSLMDLFILILKYKGLILSFVFLGAVASSTYGIVHYRSQAFVTDPLRPSGMYYSECTIEPDGVSADRLKATLMSRALARRLIETNSLMPVIKDVLLSEVDKTKTPGDRLQLNEIQDRLSKQLGFKNENGIITLTFISPSSEYPARMLNYYLKALSDAFRERVSPGIERSKKALHRQIQNESDPVLKAKLSERIIYLIEMEKTAKDAPFYGFAAIDPPSPPMIQIDPKQRSGRTHPNYVMIVLLFMLASFLLAVFLAFCTEKFRKAKREDPERFEQIKKYLHLRAK